MMSAIAFQHVVKKYGSFTALKGISLTIEEGEFFGLLGPNGAGKTTAIQILTGLSNKTSGQITVFGKDTVTEYRQARALVGLMPQEFNFDKFETTYNILYYSAGYFGLSGERRKKNIKNLLQELGLWERRNDTAIELSGGMKRKLMLARALVHEPRILILDEPTAGVDVETRKALWSYLQKLNQGGTTILLTTHYLEEAEELCRRIAIIHKGEIIKLDTTPNLLALSQKEKAKLEDIFIHLTSQ